MSWIWKEHITSVSRYFPFCVYLYATLSIYYFIDAFLQELAVWPGQEGDFNFTPFDGLTNLSKVLFNDVVLFVGSLN